MDRKLYLLSKAEVTEAGELTGYANVKGNIDRAGEVVADGAYRSLDHLVKDGFGAIGHDCWGLPIATIEEAREDEVGLYFRMAFHSTEDAQEARKVCQERIARGKSVGISIGYRVLEDAMETRDGKQVRVLKAIEVHEISIVTIPANPLAMAGGVKGVGTPLDDQVEALLDGVEDLANRLADIKNLRGRLSQTRLDQAKRLADALTKIGAVEPAAPESADDVAVFLLEQRARELGL